MSGSNIDIAALRSGLVATRDEMVCAIHSLDEDLIDAEDAIEILHARMNALDKLALGVREESHGG